MLTREENELLTRVGPGTPCGELLRRYWMPVAVAQELTPEQPTKFVRLLGEDLVLFLDKSGRVGLLADHCSHRGASLLYGRVEERGIACAYHGWLYDTQGNCLETPAEPAESLFHLTVKQRAYPVQPYVGFYWAYLGPQPAPVIPRYDVLARKDGTRRLVIQPILDCNWLQPMENSVDPAHSHALHASFLPHMSYWNGVRPSWDFWEAPIGIMKRRVQEGEDEAHPLVFPNILRQGNGVQIRVPIDDEHTWHVRVHFSPSKDGQIVEQADEDIPIVYDPPYKDPPSALHPWTKFDMALDVASQDFMAWETQGAIADRTVERLATSDRGIVMYREMLKREIERVQRGEDPKGLVRDPDHGVIDTNLQATLRAGIGVANQQRRETASRWA